jgi:hypothetical protein
MFEAISLHANIRKACLQLDAILNSHPHHTYGHHVPRKGVILSKLA